MAETKLESAREAFKKHDDAALTALAAEIERENFADPESSRILNLLGEMHRKAGRIEEALVAHRAAHHPPERTSMSAVYGLAECYVALGDKERFMAAVKRLLRSGRLDPNLASRLIVSAASLGLDRTLNQLAAVRFAPADLDAWYWVRRATAAFHLGLATDVSAFAAKARSVAAGDPEILLAVAGVDYDVSVYWDQRYNTGRGEQAPLPPAYRDQQTYTERTARETTYLAAIFDRQFGPAARFARGIDCGCGSGRLTPFLKQRVDALDCYDISETALGYARRNGGGMTGLLYVRADLSVERLPPAQYDLVFDFTVVQHQSDEAKWKAVLANYAQATRPGGHVFLVEQRGDDGPTKVPHVRNASAAAYRRELAANGCEAVLEELTPWGEICLVARRQT